MSGETNLSKLISGMRAELHAGTYVFATCARGVVPASLKPLMQFEEAEGTTLILEKSQAENARLAYEFPSRMITLNVHSSLEAVGFLAVITRKLADAGMGVNPVSGFFHDHLFVPEDRAEEAMRVLKSLSDGASEPGKNS